MRTISSPLNTVLTSNVRSTRYRLWVDSTGSLNYVDMTNFMGYDWLGDATWGDDIDTPTSTANFKIARAVHDLSLSPFMGNSKLNNGIPCIDAGRRLYLETATVPYGAAPQSGDWIRAWEGYIDDIEAHDTQMELVCRDLGCVLVDTYIETQRMYTSANLDTMIQTIITDNIITPGIALAADVNLYVPSSPTFVVLAYTQEKQTVWDAISTLAQLIGWDLRYRWDSGTSRFRLTFTSPSRISPSVLRTFGPDDYYEVPTLRISRMDIRNVGQIVYNDNSSGLRQKVQVSNGTSISKYKRRFMELSEAATSKITDVTQATNMITAAINDLASPKMEHTYGMDYFFAAEVNDYYAFTPNNKHYDSTQNAAVVSVHHNMSSESGEASTVLGMRGFPCSGVRRWIRVEGRPGVAPNADYIDPLAPANVVIAAALGAIVLTYDPPDKNNWDATEVYMSTSNIANPGQDGQGKNLRPSPGILVAKGKQTKFTITSLIPGSTYNCRILIVDQNGNVGPVSAQLTVATESVGPYHGNPDGAGAILNPNHDFNIFTKGTATFPDGWGRTDVNDLWGSGQSTYFDTSAASGKFALTLWTGNNGSGSPAVTQNLGGFMTADPTDPSKKGYIPFAAGDVLVGAAWMKWASLPSGFTSIVVLASILFYDANKTLLGGGTSVTQTGTGATGWFLGLQFKVGAPANTRYVTLTIGRSDYNAGGGVLGAPWGVGTPAIGAYFDRVAMMRGLPAVSSKTQTAGFLTTGTSNYTVATDDGHSTFFGFSASINTGTEWPCLVACNCTVQWQAPITFGTVGTVVTFWIDLWDPDSGTWANQAQIQLSGDSGVVSANLVGNNIDVKASGKVRIMALANHNTLIDYSSTTFFITAVSRKDLL